jgi:hypothetical protein
LVPIVNPLIELVNVPVPEPSVVLLFAIVGFTDVPQQTPRAVTGVPPSFVTLPPLVAVVLVIEDAAVVERTASNGVVKLTSLPYEVPTELVA